MPIDKLINFPQSSPGWDLIKQLINYYGLRDYLKIRSYELFSPIKINEIYAYNESNKSGEYIFWNKIFSGNLIEGDYVKLLNFQISPWFPRKPGLYWLPEARLARKKAHTNNIEEYNWKYIVFDIWGKILMSELGGIGCVNISKNREFVLITATSSGYTERGIPIICPFKKWTKISEALKEDRMIEVNLKGTIEPIPMSFNSYFLRTPGLPKVAVLVNSVLNIDIKISDQNIWVTPWTIFETNNKDTPYGFTYVTHNLLKDDITESVKWINEYVDRKQGKTIITDFDEDMNYLNALFPLQTGNDIVSYDAKKIISFCQKVGKDFNIFEDL